MSPYRVLIEYMLNGSNVTMTDLAEEKTSTKVLASMMSTDKTTGGKNIYILDKLVKDIKEDEYISPKFIAHTQSGRRNSAILAKYSIEKADDRSYSIYRFVENDNMESWTPLDTVEFTQSDCLKAAMHDFCSRNNYTIVQDL